MEFFVEYGMFLLKAITIVLSIIIVFGVVSFSKMKKLKNDGVLTVKDLYEHMSKNKLRVITAVSHDKKNVKQLLREIKKETKERASIKERVFVLHFNGDIRASAVTSLREEISAILLIAQPQDEVVLILESPGGAVSAYGLAASQLERIKKQHLRLTVIVDKIAASGGYMMACIADQIIAAPFSIIGSIGVVMQLPNFHDFLEKKGINFEQVTSGKFKRTLTVFGKNTDEARSKVYEEIQEIHVMFQALIKTYRPVLDMEKIATGEYWLGSKAKELGLIDTVMNSDDYIMQLYQQKKRIYLFQYKCHLSFLERTMSVCTSLYNTLHL